jgi:hypothetical protein
MAHLAEKPLGQTRELRMYQNALKGCGGIGRFPASRHPSYDLPGTRLILRNPAGSMTSTPAENPLSKLGDSTLVEFMSS